MKKIFLKILCIVLLVVILILGVAVVRKGMTVSNNSNETIELLKDKIVFINSIETLGEDYLLKCSLFEELLVSEDEVASGKVIVRGLEYNVIKRDNSDSLFLGRPYGSAYREEYYLEYNADKKSYTLKSTAQFSDVWVFLGQKVDVIVDKNANILDDTYGTENYLAETSISEYYLKNKERNIDAATYLGTSEFYNAFVFENGKCVRFNEISIGC